jgi:hypothetical protein
LFFSYKYLDISVISVAKSAGRSQSQIATSPPKNRRISFAHAS